MPCRRCDAPDRGPPIPITGAHWAGGVGSPGPKPGTRLSMRLAARWARESRSLVLRGERDGHLVGLSANGNYIIQTVHGEGAVDTGEAERIGLELSRDPGGESPYVAFNAPEMDAYTRELDSRADWRS